VARRSIFAGAIRPILARMTMTLRALLVAAAFVPRPIAAMSVARRAAMRPTILRWPFGTAFNTEYGIDLRSDISVRPVTSASVWPRRVVVLAIAVPVMAVGAAVAFVAVLTAMPAIPPMFAAIATVMP
jgi:hypothetical protein